MPIIEPSNKLSRTQKEYRICSNPYVFYRIIVDQYGARLMTATASEDAGGYRAFENQKFLISSTVQVFGDFDMEIVTKEDHAGRLYVETPVFLDAQHLIHIATTALDRMGFEDVAVLALRDMKALYEEFVIDDSGEDTYLSDGMWVRSDGRLIEK
ncbi:conserved hypothetical protein [Mesorhizobium prunaredense]|uniref:Uncharacterized protein n=1 Tax=Mesorhizobium prunaredense TaxID=1631249 RepID=A0A1R3UYQ8_9HYPH|nr:hypothetical protein [Mesorhizobium prunaredense]SIT52777.1 conserved hypothetical protein [Mesorhizobium prunaredense]